ncbi:transketolase family protein [Paenibacillus sp. CGMCC 1.18879]|uniref:transketolase family protein n=2 Tax=Paenibacillus TaxID=44249 RepID=UPI001CAA0AEE|nr:transketolase C-terminal domain-containing protein [Paenibacillus sp. CGMCC 1.18879]MBY9077514.1 1-deoxy-D-xylulose-5-phosphate synthase [Paenibacillus sp. CGMCC 1.18879]
MRDTFITELVHQAELDDRIFLITPDIGYSVLEKFRDRFPDRYLNVGIAEQNAVGVAAGLALSGKIVYVYSIIPFVTMRCFEQVRVDLAYMRTNVRMVGVGAGFSYGPAGATHHSIEDIAIMRALPNMTVCCPGDPVEVKEIIRQSVTHDGPMYIRLGKNREPKIHNELSDIKIGKASQIKKGKDLCILTTSNMLEQGYNWTNELTNYGVEASLISFHTIKPFDKEMVLNIINEGVPILTLEEHNIIGGLATSVSEVIAESGKGVKFKKIGVPDMYSHIVGDHEFIRNKLILNGNGIQEILEWL